MNPRIGKVAKLEHRLQVLEQHLADVSHCLDNERESNEKDRHKLRKACQALAVALASCHERDRETALRMLLEVSGA
jgi:hypothetical protein